MRLNLTSLVKLALFAALGLTLYKGLVKTPEMASRLDPPRFFRGLVNDAENSLIMKERHYDFNHLTLAALEMRQAELRTPGAQTPAPDSLVSPESLDLAVRKAQARDLRNADYVDLAREALERAENMRAKGWVMPLGCPKPMEAAQ
jgi:hypothetical protein